MKHTVNDNGNTNIMVEFSIYGDAFDPQYITNLLDIKPTQTWVKGEGASWNPQIKRKETGWSFSTGYIDTLYLEEPMRLLLLKFKAKTHVIREAQKKYKLNCKIEVVVNIINNEAPGLVLDAEALAFAHDIGSTMIDIDTYIL